MSFWSRPRNLVILGGVLVGAAFIPTPGSKTSYAFSPLLLLQCLQRPQLFQDTIEAAMESTKNIGARWSAGGGSDVHTPGAATPRGNIENTQENQTNASGIRSDHFQENQISQRPGEPGTFDKAWNKAHYGTEKGK
ncbi:unnamed protein product [Aureobasidium mustum]|uniref:Uncharacterized protein n=1 Tax=Aureobasidium mustum TaxID=2773714 RepID=A0A9N8JG36_9PEZI|nr:unnamed protein product [Aureobasidium mustum]